MGMQFQRRDYSLVGPDAARAVEAGLSQAEWYQCPIPRKRLKELEDGGLVEAVSAGDARGRYRLRCTHTLHSAFGMRGRIVVE